MLESEKMLYKPTGPGLTLATWTMPSPHSENLPLAYPLSVNGETEAQSDKVICL